MIFGENGEVLPECEECGFEGVHASCPGPSLEVVALIRRWYALPGNGVGGELHIVTDDQNVEDSDLEFCRRKLLERMPWPRGEDMPRLTLGLSVLRCLAELEVHVRHATCSAH